jgi:putative iron-regulated protein
VKRAMVAALLLASCTDIPIGDGPRKAVVRSVASDVIAPAHERMASAAAELEAAATALAAAPDAERLAAAQAAWRAAREPWSESLVFRGGPVTDGSYESRLDQFPIDEARIEAEIAGTTELTPGRVLSLGNNKRGFHAAEYLLFDAGGDAAALAALTTEPGAERRRQYLVATTTLLARDAASLHAAWDPAGGGFETAVVDIGGAGPYATVKDATDAVVNDSIFLAELIADAKIGKPLGRLGGQPDPALVQSGTSDFALDELRAHVRGLSEVYVGTGAGVGLSSLVAKASPATDAHVRSNLAALDAALAAIPRPFSAAVAAQAPEADAAWTVARELRVTLSTEVIAALGATLSFNSNDGD